LKELFIPLICFGFNVASSKVCKKFVF